jgi:hypothetical protein
LPQLLSKLRKHVHVWVGVFPAFNLPEKIATQLRLIPKFLLGDAFIQTIQGLLLPTCIARPRRRRHG